MTTSVPGGAARADVVGKSVEACRRKGICPVLSYSKLRLGDAVVHFIVEPTSGRAGLLLVAYAAADRMVPRRGILDDSTLRIVAILFEVMASCLN